MGRKITLEIDGKTVEAEEGMTVLQAAKKAGIEIPTLCYNEQLEPYGACRICLVEATKNGRTRYVVSCVYPVEEGLKVKTSTEKIRKMRKILLELMLPLAPASGPLRDLAEKYGVKESRFQAEPTACILCGLCVRYCAEVKKANAVSFVGRGTERQIAFVPEVAPYECPSCRECYGLCPGGKIVEAESQGLLSMPITQKTAAGKR
ncbi:MAG: 2Fe-2S iron-sulfur cluster-binding protein [Candidatus Hecatellaceae archaeon]|nr:MAG: (2Fe-2S)-binding protein [Candidatus Hecatellales archaeon]